MRRKRREYLPRDEEKSPSGRRNKASKDMEAVRSQEDVGMKTEDGWWEGLGREVPAGRRGRTTEGLECRAKTTLRFTVGDNSFDQIIQPDHLHPLRGVIWDKRWLGEKGRDCQEKTSKKTQNENYPETVIQNSQSRGHSIKSSGLTHETACRLTLKFWVEHTHALLRLVIFVTIR